jgi:hypothetical protein
MQDFIFATFLYATMICFVCWLRYQPCSATTVETATQELPTDEQNQADINQAHTREIELELELAHTRLLTETSLHEPVTQSMKDEEEAVDSSPTSLVTGHSSMNTVLYPSTLTLRQCRAVIREINKGLPKEDRIRQKINGKDAPTDWLRVQIARQLEAQPANAMAEEVVQRACYKSKDWLTQANVF